MLAVLAVLARLYLVKNWHHIRQALPDAGAGPGAGAELAVLPMLGVLAGL